MDHKDLFLYSPVYSCHLFFLSSASVRFIPFLSFTVPSFAWNVPLVSLIFLKRSLVLPIILFSSSFLFNTHIAKENLSSYYYFIILPLWNKVHIMGRQEKFKHKNSSLTLASSPFTVYLSLCTDQISPISRNICSTINGSIHLASTRQLLER